MNMNRFTEKAQEALVGAQKRAQQADNPQIESLHLLAALLADSDGVARDPASGQRQSLMTCAVGSIRPSPPCRASAARHTSRNPPPNSRQPSNAPSATPRRWATSMSRLSICCSPWPTTPTPAGRAICCARRAPRPAELRRATETACAAASA